MATYSLSEVQDLYPKLQEIARLTGDDGDFSTTDSPYQISPNDIEKYYKDRVEPLTIKGRELTPFEIVELYRQLVILDKRDGNLDGKISPLKKKDNVYLPRFAHGYQYWGKEWTPERRLNVFVSIYSHIINPLLKDVDLRFPNARNYLSGKIDSSKTRIRPLRNQEKEFVLGVASDLRQKEKPQYADLIEESVDKMAVLNVFAIPETREPAHTQASAFGYSHLFPLSSEKEILLMAYPQFKQWNFFDRRHCAKIGEVERCMPLVGLNTRKDILSDYLKPYSLGEDLTNGDPGMFGYKWFRIPQYLLRARVYNYLKYDQDIPQDIFFKMLVLHEALHHRNGSFYISRKTSDVFKTTKIFLKSFVDPYIRNTIKGEYYVLLQRAALEKIRTLTMEIEDMTRSKACFDEDPQRYADGLRGQIAFLEQLSALASEAEENVIEQEVYDVFFGEANLHEHKWTDEKGQILNPNEVELIRREDSR